VHSEVKTHTYLLLSSLLMAISPAKAQIAHHSHQPAKYTEAMALKQIRALPEVKAFYREFKNEKVDMETRDPDSTFKYYFVQVGLDRMERFMAYYNFHIDPKTAEITYWDQLNQGDDSFITLKQWRRWRSDSRFWKAHIFKYGKLLVLTK
jgi:hypothetical protein